MQTSYRNYKSYTYQRIGVQKAPKPAYNLKAKLLMLCLCMVLTGTLASTVFAQNSNGNKPSDQKAAAAPTEEEKEAEVPKKTVDLTALQPALTEIIKKYPYDTSISVVEMNSGSLVHAGDSYPYVAASTTKILTALFYLHQVETNQASLDDPINGVPARTHLQKMINRSDNESWELLNKRLGYGKLAAYARDLGLVSFDSVKNTVTSNDMANLLAKLYNDKILSDENTNLLLSWMQNTSEERFIPSAVPKEIKLYHKAGYLAERVHDVAIIDNGSTPFALVIYSKSYTSTYNYNTGQQLFKEATTQVLNTFQQ